MKLVQIVLCGIAEALIPCKTRLLRDNLETSYARFTKSHKELASPDLVSLLIAAEDHRFARHAGIDCVSILRAIWYIVVRRQIIGGSTIEQQLVRTLTHCYEKTVSRKIGELLLTNIVSMKIPKSDIPGLYLSVAYFGWRMNGLREVYSRLGLDVRSITQWQAAEVISRLKYPQPADCSLKRRAQIHSRALYILERCPEIRSRSAVRSQIDAGGNEAILNF